MVGEHRLFVSMPGSNSTIMCYRASVVKIYNTLSTLVRFENRSVLFYFEKRSTQPMYYNAGAVVVSSELVGLTPLL
jgi:hypothetical protein